MEGCSFSLALLGHMLWIAEPTYRQSCYPDQRKKEKGAAKGEMVGWHHQLSGHEFEQTPEDGEGQGSLACCSPSVQFSHSVVSNSVTPWTAACQAMGSQNVGHDLANE